MRLVPVLLLAMTCCGCSVAVSTEPLGHQTHVDAKKWDGVWTPLDPTLDDARVKFQVLDADAGELRVEVDTVGSAFVRTYGGWTFVSCRDDADADYEWFVVAMDDGVMTIWFPDVEKIGDLIDAGQLPGERIGDGNVRLFALTDADYDAMTSEQYGVLLDWKHPIVLRRVSPAVTP